MSVESRSETDASTSALRNSSSRLFLLDFVQFSFCIRYVLLILRSTTLQLKQVKLERSTRLFLFLSLVSLVLWDK
jgi:hypothetical protein